MKRIFYVVLVCLVLGLPLTLSAQTQTPSSLKATIPFDFVVNGRMYPAGTYTFVLNTEQNVVYIRQDGGRSAGFHATWNVDKIRRTAGDTNLVFRDDNGKHVLHQVWIANDDHGHDLLHPATDKDID